MLIPTYYLLSKICDIFATRRRILLKINKNYFRGGQVSRLFTIHYRGDVASLFATSLLFVYSHLILQYSFFY